MLLPRRGLFLELQVGGRGRGDASDYRRKAADGGSHWAAADDVDGVFAEIVWAGRAEIAGAFALPGMQVPVDEIAVGDDRIGREGQPPAQQSAAQAAAALTDAELLALGPLFFQV